MSEAQRKIEILESRASQFESTLKETVRAKDAEIAEITEKLRVAKEAFEVALEAFQKGLLFTCETTSKEALAKLESDK